MRHLLFPFRWLDEKVQVAVDRGAFRLMEHLRCGRRVLVLILSLITITAFVPIVVSVLAMQDSFLGFALMALVLGYGGWGTLTLYAAGDRSIHHWRQYTLARTMVASMKLLIVGGLIVGAITGLPHAHLSAPMAASLTLAALAILGNVYIQRTPLSRPVEKPAEPAPTPTPAPANL